MNWLAGSRKTRPPMEKGQRPSNHARRSSFAFALVFVVVSSVGITLAVAVLQGE
ncbi:MAG: hypothetical protein ACKVKH_04395 [Verrucomicrobiales bacterium]